MTLGCFDKGVSRDCVTIVPGNGAGRYDVAIL